MLDLLANQPHSFDAAGKLHRTEHEFLFGGLK